VAPTAACRCRQTFNAPEAPGKSPETPDIAKIASLNLRAPSGPATAAVARQAQMNTQDNREGLHDDFNNCLVVIIL